MEVKTQSFTNLFATLFSTGGGLVLQSLGNQKAAAEQKFAYDLAKLKTTTNQTSQEYALAISKVQAERDQKVAEVDAQQRQRLYLVVAVVVGVLVLGVSFSVVTVVRLKRRA